MNKEKLIKWLSAGILGALLLLMAWFASSAIGVDALPDVLAQSKTASDPIAIIKSELIKFWGDQTTRMLTAQVLILAALGMLAAWRNGVFDLAKAPDFLRKYLLPELFFYYVLRLGAEAAGYDVIRQAALVLIQGKIIALSLTKLAEMGLPMPDIVTRRLLQYAGGANG